MDTATKRNDDISIKLLKSVQNFPPPPRHVQYSSLVRVEKLNIRLVRVARVQEVSVILFMEIT